MTWLMYCTVMLCCSGIWTTAEGHQSCCSCTEYISQMYSSSRSTFFSLSLSKTYTKKCNIPSLLEVQWERKKFIACLQYIFYRILFPSLVDFVRESVTSVFSFLWSSSIDLMSSCLCLTLSSLINLATSIEAWCSSIVIYSLYSQCSTWGFSLVFSWWCFLFHWSLRPTSLVFFIMVNTEETQVVHRRKTNCSWNSMLHPIFGDQLIHYLSEQRCFFTFLSP